MGNKQANKAMNKRGLELSVNQRIANIKVEQDAAIKANEVFQSFWQPVNYLHIIFFQIQTAVELGSGKALAAWLVRCKDKIQSRLYEAMRAAAHLKQVIHKQPIDPKRSFPDLTDYMRQLNDVADRYLDCIKRVENGDYTAIEELREMSSRADEDFSRFDQMRRGNRGRKPGVGALSRRLGEEADKIYNEHRNDGFGGVGEILIKKLRSIPKRSEDEEKMLAWLVRIPPDKLRVRIHEKWRNYKNST